MTARTLRSERIDLRLSKDAKRILQRAAQVKHKTVSEFVLDSSINAAYDAISDQRTFVLDQKQWAAFIKRLDAPPKPNARLRKLMERKPAWER